MEDANNREHASGVKTEEIRKGRIWGVFRAIWKGMFGNHSLTKILGKTKKNLRKNKEKPKKT